MSTASYKSCSLGKVLFECFILLLFYRVVDTTQTSNPFSDQVQEPFPVRDLFTFVPQHLPSMQDLDSAVLFGMSSSFSSPPPPYVIPLHDDIVTFAIVPIEFVVACLSILNAVQAAIEKKYSPRRPLGPCSILNPILLWRNRVHPSRRVYLAPRS